MNKKKLLSLMLALGMTASLAACGGGGNAPAGGDTTKPAEGGDAAPAGGTYELALITDVGTIDDKSFNQGSWEGLKKYAEEKGITHQYYKPTEASDASYEDAIALAIKGGAKVVVLPGYLFEVPVYNSQTKYPDVKFVLIDGEPHTTDYATYKTESNTTCILYAEQQAGFLAGYGAVKDGYTKLGFMGGMAVPAVTRFGYGFVQGANYAADELGMADGAISMKYKYLGDFGPTPEHQADAAAWYKDGTEVIFAAAGGAGNSVMSAAQTANGKVIGVDVDQSSESDTVISSAMKNLGKAVYDAVDSVYADKFAGGKTTLYDAKIEGIQLPMDTSKWQKFDQAQYDALYKKMADGAITVKGDTDAESADKLETPKVSVSVEG